MLEVRIPDEIKNYKEKLFFGLTLRQSICSFFVLAINIPLYLFGRKFLNEEILIWIIIAIGMLLSLMGFSKINEMYFEDFIFVMLDFSTNPQKRTKKTRG